MIHLQGHGRTTLGERPILMPDIADDLAVILDKLGYRQVDALRAPLPERRDAGRDLGGAAGRCALNRETVC